MKNGVGRGAACATVERAWARDALGAIALAEGALAQRVFVGLDGDLRFEGVNAFGDKVIAERSADVAALARRFGEVAQKRERVALIAPVDRLVDAQSILRAIARSRLGVVAHALLDSQHDVHALTHLGWGLLVASSVGESLDLALVARRAAEDSGTPFFVVHERSHVRYVEPVASPSREICEGFVGAPRRALEGPGPIGQELGARAFAERVPFALASAMRELEALTGRKHDVFERVPAADAAMGIVGVGALGDSLTAEVDRLRRGGHDVGAIRIVALRPFPGARLVKALARALAITVVEREDTPLAQSNPLASEIKAAFADAITWAPHYPGVGSIPNIASGVASRGEIDPDDVDAMVANMQADERGKRIFVLDGAGDPAYALEPRAPSPPVSQPLVSTPVGPGPFSMRGCVRDEETAIACADLCVAVIASALGLRVRASVRPLNANDGGGHAFDLVASRERPRGQHVPHTMGLIAVDDPRAFAEGNPIARLAHAGLVAVPTTQGSADALWAEIPAYVKAIVFDRGARVVGWAPGAAGGGEANAMWTSAAAFAGLALAAALQSSGGARLPASSVAREVADALRVALAQGGRPADERWIADAADVAKHAFESPVEVPRATVERDQEAIRLGRRDARAGLR